MSQGLATNPERVEGDVVYPGGRCVYDSSSITAITVLLVGDQLDGRDLLPGFSLSLADLFEVDLVDEGEDTPAPPAES